MAVQVLVVKEQATGERRVAATPETVKKLVALGAAVSVQAGAGASAGFPDALYQQAGAQLGGEVGQADLVLCVQAPEAGVLQQLKRESVLVGMLHPQADAERAAALQAQAVVAFPLERLPRTTRAQAMDVLSSQASLKFCASCGLRSLLQSKRWCGTLSGVLLGGRRVGR